MGDGWSGAASRAALILAASAVGFLVIPDRAMAFLTTRLAPGTRDVLVSLWVVVCFVLLCWAVLVVQRRQR